MPATPNNKRSIKEMSKHSEFMNFASQKKQQKQFLHEKLFAYLLVQLKSNVVALTVLMTTYLNRDHLDKERSLLIEVKCLTYYMGQLLRKAF